MIKYRRCILDLFVVRVVVLIKYTFLVIFASFVLLETLSPNRHSRSGARHPLPVCCSKPVNGEADKKMLGNKHAIQAGAPPKTLLRRTPASINLSPQTCPIHTLIGLLEYSYPAASNQQQKLLKIRVFHEVMIGRLPLSRGKVITNGTNAVYYLSNI